MTDVVRTIVYTSAPFFFFVFVAWLKRVERKSRRRKKNEENTRPPCHDLFVFIDSKSTDTESTCVRGVYRSTANHLFMSR